MGLGGLRKRLRLIFFNCHLSKKSFKIFLLNYISYAINQFFKKASVSISVCKSSKVLMLFLCFKLKIRPLVTAFCLFGALYLSAQNPSRILHSLIVVSDKQPNDSLKIDYLNKVFVAYCYSKPEIARRINCHEDLKAVAKPQKYRKCTG